MRIAFNNRQSKQTLVVLGTVGVCSNGVLMRFRLRDEIQASESELAVLSSRLRDSESRGSTLASKSVVLFLWYLRNSLHAAQQRSQRLRTQLEVRLSV